MSLTLALILSAGAAGTPAPNDQKWDRTVTAAHEMAVPTSRLFAALSSAPAPRRSSRPLYCFEDSLTDPAAPRMLCRTLAEWAEFGLEPVTGGQDVVAAR